MLLTTQHKNYDPNWCRHVIILPGYIEDWKRFGGQLPIAKSLIWGWKLFRLSRQFQVVVTGSERLAFVFAGLQKFRRRKVPHIFVQSMWNLPHTRVRRWIKRTLLRVVASSATRVVVYSRRQLDVYPRQLGLPREKFVFLYSHTSLYNKEYRVNRGDYVFSGGDSNRDYATLIAAAHNLPCRVVIVSHHLVQQKLATLPGNVEVIAGLPADEFNRMMAGAALVVVPLRAGALETGGRTVYGNAMSMGKAVIVADDDAGDYITDEHDGVLVPAGDVSALNRAIIRVLTDDEFRICLERNAKETAKAFAPETFFNVVFSLADQCMAQEMRVCTG